MNESGDAITGELGNFPLFTGLSPTELLVIAAQAQILEFQQAQFVALEGEKPDQIFLILEGQAEIVKSGSPDPARPQRVAILEKGGSVGEMALLDYQPRSASVRTLAPSRFYVLSLARLKELNESHKNIYRVIVENTEKEICQRLRYTTEVTVVALQETLKQSRIRELMGHFLVNVFIILCVYAFVLGCTVKLVSEISISILISAALLVSIVVPAILIVNKRGRRSLDFYGLTATNWRSAIREAMTWTLPILALAVAVKRIAILHPAFSHLSVFSGRLSQNPTYGPYLLELGIYVVLAAVQEFLVRGVLQGSLQEFLTGRYVIWKSILISNLLFSTLHLHLSVSFALMAFLPGLFWGWLYSRHRTLIGVTISHILIGAWIFYFVGVHGILLSGTG
jgi:CRP-like cAMP-binding protein